MHTAALVDPLVKLPRWMPALLIAAIVAMIMLLPASRAAAVEGGEYGIRPASEPDFFHLSVAPGSAVDAEAVVSNYTTEPVTLRSYPVDATSEANGFAAQEEAAPREGVGAWVRLEGDEVTVPAGSDARVRFTLSVPAGTTPGDYAGALIVQAPPVAGETTEVDDDMAVRMDVVQRLGARIYLNVAGEAVRGLEPGELTWERTGDSLTFSLPITNTGNTNLDPRAELALEGWPGERQQLTFESSQELLTGSTHVLETTVDVPATFFFGSAEATVASEAGESQVSTDVVYAEWWLLTGVIVALILAALIAWRVTRFVRRARAAIAEVEQRSVAV